MFYTLHEEDYKLNGKSLSQYEAVKLLAHLKACPGYEFLNEVDSNALRLTVEDLYKSYKAFFKKKAKKPHLKSKKKEYEQSYSTQMINSNIKIGKNFIRLPKIGDVKAVIHTFVKGEIKRATFK